MSPELSPTPRSTVRKSARARTDRADLHAVLDAGLVAHLGVVVDGAPLVLPTTYGRVGDTVYVHASTGAPSLRAAAGHRVCLTVTLLDGLVYARSVFHHSANYRSAVLHAEARPVTDPQEKLAALRALVEHVTPGSWEHARGPSAKELAATAVLAIDTSEASVKVRQGPPVDDDADVEAGTAWAGVLPVTQSWGEPQPCALLPVEAAVPAHVRDRG
ncbi:pyridoxamine 5'-phosphate oxidase family protein [Rhodococcus sp. X156]|uniref:pyridoxamine 5'-phosphate oxidase family protein n=1 Tax=Rhodococcus sp. X156 TaxID=2499145 RepID=UPI000FD8C8F6|nr:pyridoxamine 5'-phosphate oxidase family protein [Rhodococcus sp. X156]